MKEFTLLRNDKFQILIFSIMFLFIWQIVAVLINNDIYLPTLGQVFNSIDEIINSKRFCIDIFSSVGRCIFSFLFALITALILGILSYANKIFRNLLKPINALAQSIPTMVLVVLTLIWFDKDDTPFIVGFAIVFPILYESVLGSITGIDKKILEMAELYNIDLKYKILKIYLPNIKFQLASILGSTFSLALKVVIAGEVHGQPTYGMGTMIQLEKINFNTSGIFGWIIIIILISLMLNICQKIILRRVFIWKN
ncbi:ABC transporter permease subunit [Romboutsia maritimum]|uniref:ABC transporter permease subunit n=1 Tax=Romboutsia maritimum TaxID=2020948 RepID=A0A371IT64_9FIRM|nr:ABC transporter permease subunit [Romboutsia maritimum]RDY23649.1 ABC transporter permease subunit [Romboutsia maritimum]